jgi:hypothetical protein
MNRQDSRLSLTKYDEEEEEEAMYLLLRYHKLQRDKAWNSDCNIN